MPPGDSKADLGKRGCPRYPVVVITRDFERRVTLALSKEKEGKGSPLTGERYCPEVHKEHPGGCATGDVLGPRGTGIHVSGLTLRGSHEQTLGKSSEPCSSESGVLAWGPQK